MKITEETRLESYRKLNSQYIRSLIVDVLETGNYTAREIASILYTKHQILSPERQAVQPRLTELCDKGKIKEIGKRYDTLTHRNVTIYELRENENIKGDKQCLVKKK